MHRDGNRRRHAGPPARAYGRAGRPAGPQPARRPHRRPRLRRAAAATGPPPRRPSPCRRPPASGPGRPRPGPRSPRRPWRKRRPLRLRSGPCRRPAAPGDRGDGRRWSEAAPPGPVRRRRTPRRTGAPARRVEPPAVALVGDGRTAEAVADHVATRRQGRRDHLRDVLGPRRQQQDVRPGGRGRQGGVEEEGADAFAGGGAAGLAGQHRPEVEARRAAWVDLPVPSPPSRTINRPGWSGPDRFLLGRPAARPRR